VKAGFSIVRNKKLNNFIFLLDIGDVTIKSGLSDLVMISIVIILAKHTRK